MLLFLAISAYIRILGSTLFFSCVLYTKAMYIELFLLDNTLMNLLILRAACALSAHRAKFRLLLGVSFLGAVYGALCQYFPFLGCLPMKILAAAAMACALLPGRGGLSALPGALGTVLGACFLVGGLCWCLLLAIEGNGALTLRVTLLSAALAAYLPRPIRALLRRRRTGTTTLVVEHGGQRYSIPCMTDTGNLLYEPLSGLPVAVAYLPALAGSANIPVPVSTVNGTRMLYAFRPEKALLAGQTPLDILIALSPEPLAAALLPPAALPNTSSEVCAPC